MAAKKITLDWSETAKTVYAIIRREADGYRMNDADGTFAAAPTDPYLSLVEDSVIKGRYEASEARTVWTNGRYTFAVYKQAGGSPAPVSDTIIGTGEMWIVSDAEVAIDATVSSRLASASYTAPDNAGIAALPLLSVIEGSTVLAKQTKLDFIEKWILNKLVESSDGTTVTLYGDDGVTPLKTWAYSSTTKTRSKAT